jgi:AMMECR1 domain-containing protein
MTKESLRKWLWTMGMISTYQAAAEELPSDLARWVQSATSVQVMTLLRHDLIESASCGRLTKPSATVPWPDRPQGVFVSLMRGNQVIGCMGSFQPPREDLYTAVLRTALRATREDIRHPPLRARDLATARIVVTFVDLPQPIENPEVFSPWCEGLLAVQGNRSAVVVPGEAKTSRYALELALRQSGIHPDETVEYHRFDALTWREEADP